MIAQIQRVVSMFENETIKRYLDGTIESVSDNNVESIDNGLFRGCSNLTTASFPNVKTIGTSAFYSCQKLENLYFPTCSEIGPYAFGFACSNNVKVEFPNVEIVNSSAFQSTGILSFSFPKCTTIKGFAFAYCRSATSMHFPKANYIGDYAFNGCQSLKTISLDSLEYLDYGERTFAYCYSLESIYLPKLKSLNGSAIFYNCSNLKTISAPELEYISSWGSEIFGGYVSNISELYLPKCSYINSKVFALAGISYLRLPKLSFNQYSTSLFADCRMSKLELPSYSSMYIPSSFFNGCINLSAIHGISETAIKGIGTSAFYRCSSITNIRLDSCSYIDEFAFGFCSGLKTIDIPECTRLGHYAFEYCNNLETVRAPKLSVVKSFAFYEDTKLKVATIPECTSISTRAFFNCSSLKNIDIPKCSYIGNEAFRSCSSLENMDITSAESIGSFAFYDCSNLKSVNLSKACFISHGAFSSCVSLTEFSAENHITFPSNAIVFSGCENLSTMRLHGLDYLSSEYAMAINAGNIRTLDLINCKSIGDDIGYGTYFRTVENLILDNCEYIGEIDWVHSIQPNLEAKLKGLYLPKCSYIGSGAFKNCLHLSSVTLSNIETIGADAFYMDYKLYSTGMSKPFTDLTVILDTKSVVNIFSQEFAFDFYDPDAGSSRLRRTWEHVTILVPKELYSAYMNRYSNCGFTSRILMMGTDT